MSRAVAVCLCSFSCRFNPAISLFEFKHNSLPLPQWLYIKWSANQVVQVIYRCMKRSLLLSCICRLSVLKLFAELSFLKVTRHWAPAFVLCILTALLALCWPLHKAVSVIQLILRSVLLSTNNSFILICLLRKERPWKWQYWLTQRAPILFFRCLIKNHLIFIFGLLLNLHFFNINNPYKLFRNNCVSIWVGL